MIGKHVVQYFIKLYTYKICQTTLYIVMVLSTITGTMIIIVIINIVVVTIIIRCI